MFNEMSMHKWLVKLTCKKSSPYPSDTEGKSVINYSWEDASVDFRNEAFYMKDRGQQRLE